jgi:hypothetical protein
MQQPPVAGPPAAAVFRVLCAVVASAEFAAEHVRCIFDLCARCNFHHFQNVEL